MRLQSSDGVDSDDDDGMVRRNCRPVQPRGTRRVRTAPGINGPGLLPAAGHHPHTVSLLPRRASSSSIGGGGDSGSEEPFRGYQSTVGESWVDAGADTRPTWLEWLRRWRRWRSADVRRLLQRLHDSVAAAPVTLQLLLCLKQLDTLCEHDTQL